ncbi:unnamed protein product [Durusdinium trenchii]|uniref:Uncharacterized protein n=1 Tax=Durusdinium trenchii TaxID=1381693 RepID=A0ABP0LAA7_9DINO
MLLIRYLLAVLAVVLMAAEASTEPGCEGGTESAEKASLVQRNRSSSKVMLTEDLSQVRGQSFLELQEAGKSSSMGKHMVLALTAAIPEEIAFPFEILLPIAFILALLGLCVVTNRSEPDAFLLKPATDSPAPRTPLMFSQSPPRASRPHELSQTNPTSSSPTRESLICLCPSLVVPERVECTILVPQVAALKSKSIKPLCDIGGGTIFELEVFPEKNIDGVRLILHSPSRGRKFASCRNAATASGRGFTLQGQDTAHQAQLHSADSGCFVTAPSRQSIRFRNNSPGSINASDDEGQLLAYSDPTGPDAEGLPQLVLKVGPKVDAGAGPGGLENELVRAQREAQRRLDEATKKEAPKWSGAASLLQVVRSQLRDDAEGLLWLMGGYAWAARGGDEAAEAFCQKNKINPRQMAEAHSLMQQLAELLQRRLCLSSAGFELQLPLLPRPPTPRQVQLLRECIAEGLLDRVAIASPDLGHRAYICADLGRERPVYIHTASNAFRHRPHPSVLVFNEIISTHKPFMRDCINVDPLHLAKRAAAGGCPLLSLGEFIPVPGPRYLPEQDKVLAFASPSYIPLSYALPTVEVEVPANSIFRYKVFAKALLEGMVVRDLPAQDKLLAKPTLLLHAPTNPRVSALVSPLWQFKVGSRGELYSRWKHDSRFLLEGYLKWVPNTAHDDVRMAWPPM